MSTPCQKIDIRRINNTHTADEITNFTSAVCAVVIAMSCCGGSGDEDLFLTWGATYSGNYQDTFSVVANGSGDWNYTYSTILTGGEIGGSLNIAGQILSGGVDIKTLITDSQTLTFNENTAILSISNGNSVSLSSLSGGSPSSIDLSQIAAASGNWNATYTTVAQNSAGWNYQGSDIKPLTATWQNASTAVQDNSAAWILSGISVETDPVFTTWLNSNSATIGSVYSTVNENSAVTWNYQGMDVKVLTAFWQNVYNTVQENSSIWVLSGISVETDPIFTAWAQSFSANYQSVYNTVQNNSAVTWNYQGNDIKPLTANWELIRATVESNSALWILSGGASVPETDPIFTAWAQTFSANYQSGFTTVNSNSSNWETSFLYSTIFSNNSANYANLLTVVQANSAVNWNYQGNDIKSLTANWELIRATVESNSALWILSGLSVETDPIFTSWATTYSADFQSTFNTVRVNSAQWALDTDNAEVNTVVQTTSANWNSNYTIVNTNSAGWETIEAVVQSNSATWATELDPIFTAWAASFSGLFSSNYTTVQTNSSNWNTSYVYSLVFAANSALYSSVYNTVNGNSAVTWNYQGTDVKVLTATWESTWTTVNDNSSNWNTAFIYSTVYSNNSANYGSVFTTVNSNSASWGTGGAMPSGVQGDILYHNGVAFVQLNANTSGKVLKTFGTGANPAWVVPAWAEGIALSDLDTALTVSTTVAKGQITLDRAVTLTSVQFDVSTAPTGAALQFDVKKNGTTIFSTKPTIDISEFSTLTAAVAQVLSTTTGVAGDVFTFFVTQIGSTIAGAGLQARMIGTALLV